VAQEGVVPACGGQAFPPARPGMFMKKSFRGTPPETPTRGGIPLWTLPRGELIIALIGAISKGEVALFTAEGVDVGA